MKFEFATATHIIFGVGALQGIGVLTTELGTHALVVGGRALEQLTPLLDLLRTQGIETTLFSVPAEPTVDLVLEAFLMEIVNAE